MTVTNIRKIINAFVNNIDNSKEYSLKELDTVLSNSYKENNVKRLPTAYNIYIKEKMAELKATNPSLTAKDLLQMAAAGWAEHKKQHPDLSTASSTSVPSQAAASQSVTSHATAPPPTPEPEQPSDTNDNNNEQKTPRSEPVEQKETPGAPKKPARKSKATSK